MTVQLYQGDCLEFMRGMDAGSVDAVITDPPYGIGLDYGVYKDTRENLKKMILDFIPLSMYISSRTIVTCGVNNIWIYPEPTWSMSWQYQGGTPKCSWGFSTWQPILVYGKDPKLANGLGCYPDSVSMATYEKSNGHPANKPIRFMKWLVSRTSNPGETIFDPFMGSGTTGVAAVQLGRNFIGCEIDPGYFKIAEKRIHEATLQPALFQVEQRQEVEQGQLL